MGKPTDKKKIRIGQAKKIVIRRSKTRRLKIKGIAFLKEHKLYVIGFAVLLGIGIIITITLLPRDKAKVNRNDVLSNLVDTLQEVATEKIEMTSNFLYPELLPIKRQHALYEKEVIAEDITIEKFFYKRGLSKFKSKEIAFQAKTKQLVGFKKSHDLYAFGEDETTIGDFFVYEIAMDSIVLISLLPNPEIVLHTIPLTTRVKKIAGIVKGNFFWTTFLDNEGEYYRLMPEILNALQWQIDFFHVNPNDRYKLLVEEKWHNGKRVEIGNVLAMYYQQKDKEYYAFRFQNDGKTAYYDENGAIMKMRFLKSPVEYNIINSPYNPNRMHPIHKVEMPHYGTDYFANLNDPVFAIGKGHVLIAGTTNNNGNYVKIKHDQKYQSQYLHLTSFGSGIRKGKVVEQGDIIGYAGDTGLAAGVHVCFRFWMDGKQVDHTKEAVFQSATPSNQVIDIKKFKLYSDSLQAILDEMIYN